MESNLTLNKKIYSTKGALEKLDEEFVEFVLPILTPKQFFDLYNKYFDELDKQTHNYFFGESQKLAFPEGYINPKEIEVNNLRDQEVEIITEINEVEREHPYFKNGSVISNISFINEIDAVLEGSNFNHLYYMQSGKKRKIKNYQTYLNLKIRITKRLGDISNEDFIVFVDYNTLGGIQNGPPINSLQDIFISNKEINTYNQTVTRI